MSGMGSSCGTGLGTYVPPNDPNLDSPILSATSTLVGIRLNWTYPNVNPQAVAYTNVFRNTTPDDATAAQIGIAQGGTYLDQTTVDTQGIFYYWIQMVSVNGTQGPWIGPVSASQLPTVDKLIDILEGRLDDSVLNQALKAEIDRITDISSAVSDEEQERLLGDNVLSQLMSQIQTDLDAVDTLVQSEIVQRVSDNDALVAEVDFILAKANDNAAAILTEQAVRASEDQAIALSVTTIEATANSASVAAQQAFTLAANVDGSLSGTYTVKIDANGYVSGFGLYNDGNTSEFIVRADRFAVGMAGQSDKFPFIIDTVNGQSVIALNAAVFIPDASITNAKIESTIQSDNYNFNGGNPIGWQITKNGNAFFESIYARGNIEALSLRAGVAMVDTLNLQGESVTIPRGASGGSQSTKQVTLTYPSNGRPSAIIVSGSVTITGQSNNSIQRASLSASTGSLNSREGRAALFESAQQYTIPVFGIVNSPGGTSCTISLNTSNLSGSSFSQIQWNLIAIGAKR